MAAVLLAALVILYSGELTLAIKCLECDVVDSLDSCLATTECEDYQSCYVKKERDESLAETFTFLCETKEVCKEINQTPAKREDPVTLCQECCDSDLCQLNLTKCYQPVPNLRCYSCHHMTNIHECNTFSYCESHQVCFAQEVQVGGQSLYDMGCMSQRECRIADNAYRHHNTSGFFYFSCCGEDFCNSQINKNFTHTAATDFPPATTLPTTTLPLTTLPIKTLLTKTLQTTIQSSTYTTATTARTTTATTPATTTGIPTIAPGVKPPEKITVNYGELVNLTCSFHSDPPPTYKWLYHNGSGEVDVTLLSNMTGDHSVLTLKDTTPSQNGEYICKAISGNVSANVSTVINVHTDPPKAVNTGGKNHMVAVGHPVNLTCQFTSNPPPHYYWFFRNRTGSSDITAQARMVDDVSILTLPSVKASQAGQYVCEATNGFDPPVNVSTKLTVTDPPVVVTHPNNTMVKENDDVELVCLVHSVPPPVYSWILKKPGGLETTVTAKSHRLQDKSVLSLPHVQASDQGTYICQATSAGVKVTSPPAVVTVLTIPTFITPAGDITATKGQNVTLSCHGKGNPEPTITWGVMDTTGFPKTVIETDDLKFSENRTVLIITSLTEETAGSYFCKLHNTVGQAIHNVTVTLST